ncbi:hypothetical protein HDU97_007683 [Phlyctochytrium planicorne]|nr:hypothetical protein HDU97_007683 [Phlyctochytrium planicorne]
MLPSESQFNEYVSKLGIERDSHVVVYDSSQAIGSAARVLWTFRVFGHEGISVLDGGLQKWKLEKRPVEDGPVPNWTPTNYVGILNPKLVASFSDVRGNLEAKVAEVIDARPGDRFLGTAPEPRPIPSGHIPSSKSIPSSLYTNGISSFKEPTELRELFLKNGVDTSKPVIHSCGSGVNACIGWLATVVSKQQDGSTWVDLEKDASVYDGSWTEWASKEADGAKIESRHNI